MEPGEGNFERASAYEDRKRAASRHHETPTEMLESWAGTLNEEIRFQANVRPYLTVMAAGLAGYVLGAGVPRWAYRVAWDVGSKALLARVIGSLVDRE